MKLDVAVQYIAKKKQDIGFGEMKKLCFKHAVQLALGEDSEEWRIEPDIDDFSDPHDMRNHQCDAENCSHHLT